MKALRLSTVIAAVAILAILVSCNLVEERAKSQAKAFCKRFPIGSSFQEAVKQAQAARMHHVYDNTNTVSVSFYGGWLFSSHVCYIHGAHGKVVEVEYEYFD